MQDLITTALTDNGGFRIYAAVTTNLVREASQIHGCSPLASAALGRTLTAAAIMGAMQKEDNASVTIQFKGDGPLGSVVAVGSSRAHVKGWIQNPGADLPLNSKGKLDVGGGIGKGFLSVVRDAGNGKMPYTGQVELVSGEVAEDLTYYYAVSEQTPTAMALGVLVDTDCTPKCAGGWLVQMMPGVGADDEKIITQIEKSIKELPPVTTMIDRGMTPEEITSALLGDIKYGILNREEPCYKCDCSRGRVERALISVGAKDLRTMLAEDNGTEVDCHFCGKKYKFTADELERLSEIAERKK